MLPSARLGILSLSQVAAFTESTCGYQIGADGRLQRNGSQARLCESRHRHQASSRSGVAHRWVLVLAQCGLAVVLGGLSFGLSFAGLSLAGLQHRDSQTALHGVPGYISAFADPNLRGYAVKALAEKYGDQAAPRLALGVDHPQESVRSGSLFTLQILGNRATAGIPGLVKVLTEAENATVEDRLMIVRVLANLRPQAKSEFQKHGPHVAAAFGPVVVRASAQSSHPDSPRHQSPGLHTPGLHTPKDTTRADQRISEWLQRRLALQALALFGTAEVHSHFQRALSADDARLRVLAVGSLGKFAPESLAWVRVLLIRSLKDDEGEVARRAAWGLRRFGKSAVGPLVWALSHADPRVQQAAASSLAHLGVDAAPAVTHLASLLQDSSRPLRVQARSALQAIGPPSVGPLLWLLRHPRESVRLDAIDALSKIHPAPITRLRQALHNPAPLVRAGAADALGELRVQAQAAVFELKQIARRPEETAEVRLSAAWASRQIENSLRAQRVSSASEL